MRKLPEAVFLAALVCAAPASAAQVSVSDAWIRALPANLPAGGYFTMKNPGAKDVALTGAASPACGMLMLHKSSNRSGMEQMDDVESVTVPAHGSVTFAPGGYHLMCMAPAPSLKPGAKVPVELQFSDGTKMSVSFAVKDARGK